MPSRYNEGPEKAYRKGRAPIYKDTEPAPVQKRKERMLRKQIKRKFKYNPDSGLTRPEWTELAGTRKTLKKLLDKVV